MESNCCHSTLIKLIDKNYHCLNIECENYSRITTRVSRYTSKFKFLIVFFVFNTVSFGYSINTKTTQKSVVKTQEIEFSEENLIVEINKLNPTYRTLCLAQCQFETSMGQSEISKKTNNLFMVTVFYLSEPHISLTINGVTYHFKVYSNWVESVQDWYRLVSSKQDMAQIEYMEKYYCKDLNYSNTLRKIYNQKSQSK